MRHRRFDSAMLLHFSPDSWLISRHSHWFSRADAHRPLPGTTSTALQRLLIGLILALGLAMTNLAMAQTAYPNKPIHVVLPFPAGTSPDVIVRLWGERLGKATDQSVVVDNKPGATTIIGAQLVATAPADGYTLLYAVNNTLSINPYIYENLPYKADDFVPIVRLVTVPYVLLVPASSPFKTLEDLIKAAKQNPGKLSYGSFGVGQGTHVAMARLLNEADISAEHIPYNATPYADLIAGRIDMLIDAPTTTLQLIKAGKIRALGVMGTERLDSLPDVPTVAETLPGFVVESWHGILAPKGTPPDVIETLSRVSQEVIAANDFRAKIRDYGLVPADSHTPDEFAQYLKEDARIWSKVVRDNNIKAH